MQTKRNDPSRRLRPGTVAALGILVAVVVVWVIVIPVSLGYHVGFNAATDHECLSRVLQWCRP